MSEVTQQATETAIQPTDLRTEMIRGLARKLLHEINQFDYSELKDVSELKEETRAIIVHSVALACTHACKDVGLEKVRFLELCSTYANSVYPVQVQVKD